METPFWMQVFFYGAVGIASQPISIKELKNGLIGIGDRQVLFHFTIQRQIYILQERLISFNYKVLWPRMMMKIIKSEK